MTRRGGVIDSVCGAGTSWRTTRIRDTRLAEFLGFERPREIRRLIGFHRRRLESDGPVLDPFDRGCRRGTEYWLTAAQAVQIAFYAGTERARALNLEINGLIFDIVSEGRSSVEGKPVLRQFVELFKVRAEVCGNVIDYGFQRGL